MYAMCDATNVCNVQCNVLVLYFVQSGMYVCFMVDPKDIVFDTCNADTYEFLLQQK